MEEATSAHRHRIMSGSSATASISSKRRAVPDDSAHGYQSPATLSRPGTNQFRSLRRPKSAMELGLYYATKDCSRNQGLVGKPSWQDPLTSDGSGALFDVMLGGDKMLCSRPTTKGRQNLAYFRQNAKASLDQEIFGRYGYRSLCALEPWR
jgi:hypothetical protein